MNDGGFDIPQEFRDFVRDYLDEYGKRLKIAGEWPQVFGSYDLWGQWGTSTEMMDKVLAHLRDNPTAGQPMGCWKCL
jgi:hypothetical protein